MKQPNIIYILGDDHRQDFSAMAHHPFLQTPNLEKLAEDGVYFENSFCTSPVCTPSRTCHYTGCWERAHGINFNSQSAMSRSAWENTFPVLLRKAGYQTAWIGKNHVPVGEQGYKTGAMEQTFDYWYGNHGHSKFYPKEAPNGRIYSNAKADTQIEIFEEGAMNFLDPQPAFIESCVSPLTYRDTTKPFCMCITFNLPHDCSTETMELRPTDDEIYKSLYRDRKDTIQPPKTYIAQADITTPRLPKEVYSGEYITSYNYVKTVPDLQERIVRICQTVTGMDRMIGHLREKLEELGIAEDTIIVFSTDHGIHHGEHGLGGKCFLYQEDLRIPLVIYDPRNQKMSGKRVQEMVAVPDFAPTVLAMAGVTVPETMQGTSLMPLLQGQETEWRNELFVEQLMDTQNYPKSEAICTPEWKYIRYFARHDDPKLATYRIKNSTDDYYAFLENPKTGATPVVYEELYHLAQDRYEEINLAAAPEHAERMGYFRTRLNEMAAERIVPDTAERVCKDSIKLYVFEDEAGYYPAEAPSKV